MSPIAWLLLGALLLLAIGDYSIISKQKATNKRLQRDLAYYSGTYLRKQGWSSGFGTYELRSFDGGVTWYAVEYKSKAEGLKILGLAEDVYPGLMAYLAGWDRLISYVQRNGPIGSNGAITDQDMRALTGAGFTVHKS